MTFESEFPQTHASLKRIRTASELQATGDFAERGDKRDLAHHGDRIAPTDRENSQGDEQRRGRGWRMRSPQHEFCNNAKCHGECGGAHADERQAVVIEEDRSAHRARDVNGKRRNSKGKQMPAADIRFRGELACKATEGARLANSSGIPAQTAISPIRPITAAEPNAMLMCCEICRNTRSPVHVAPSTLREESDRRWRPL